MPFSVLSVFSDEGYERFIHFVRLFYGDHMIRFRYPNHFRLRNRFILPRKVLRLDVLLFFSDHE